MMLWALVPVVLFSLFMIRKGKRSPLSFSLRRLICATLSLSLCVLALARPQFGHHVAKARGTKANLILAIDISQSMMAEDVTPNRLNFSIAFSRKLLSQLTGARVALYPFASDGYLQMPLTTDLTAVSDVLATLDPSMTSSQGTDLSTALRTMYQVINRMRSEAEEQRC